MGLTKTNFSFYIFSASSEYNTHIHIHPPLLMLIHTRTDSYSLTGSPRPFGIQKARRGELGGMMAEGKRQGAKRREEEVTCLTVVGGVAYSSPTEE